LFIGGLSNFGRRTVYEAEMRFLRSGYVLYGTEKINDEPEQKMKIFLAPSNYIKMTYLSGPNAGNEEPHRSLCSAGSDYVEVNVLPHCKIERISLQ
jgi:hypothetical protein